MLGFLAVTPPGNAVTHGRHFHRPATNSWENRAAAGVGPSLDGPRRLVTPPVCFVLGGPGSGKGTQCARLVQNYGWIQICVGDLLRAEAERDEAVREILAIGSIVPGEVTMALLEKEVQRHRTAPGILIDGFPRAMDQALMYEKLVGACHMVLFFDAPEDTLRKRLLSRGETSGRQDDESSVIEKRLTTFTSKSYPVVDHYRKTGQLRTIQATNSVDQVYDEVQKLFNAEFPTL